MFDCFGKERPGRTEDTNDSDDDRKSCENFVQRLRKIAAEM